MYLITVTDGTQCQNKLHKAIAELLHKQNRRLLTELEATKFRDDLLQHLQGLNEKYPKCKPITNCHWHEHPFNRQLQTDWCLILSGHTFITLRMLYGQQDT